MKATHKCSIKECPNKKKALGWCSKHHWRWLKYGDPLHLPPRPTMTDRFWAKVNKDGPIPAHRPELGRCWVWTAAFYEAGYGEFWMGERVGRKGAHVASWTLAYGEITGQLWVLHHCDNRACVRPDHLFLGTQSDNMRDMWGKDRGGGGAAGALNAHAKLTETQVVEIRTRFDAGERGVALSLEFGVNQNQISRIVTGKLWPHAGGPIRDVNHPRRAGARNRKKEAV